VPPGEGFEGGLVPLLDEATQELAVGQPAAVAQQHGPAEVPDGTVRVASRQVAPSLADSVTD
jgi:hypothetical protein